MQKMHLPEEVILRRKMRKRRKTLKFTYAQAVQDSTVEEIDFVATPVYCIRLTPICFSHLTLRISEAMLYL